MKKGFTLVEVLAVVVILGLLVAIISPTVKNLLGDSEDALHNEQVDMVINATKKYMIEHSEFLPDIGGVNSITISKLIDEGVIDNDKVLDPKTKEQMNGCVVVSYNRDFNQYEYNYSDDNIKCNYISNGFFGDGGLYEAQGEPGRLIFRGANPNNYIALKEDGENDVLYRIVSFETDGTIKVVRDEGLSVRKAWDERTTETTGPRKNDSNSFCNVLYGNTYRGCNVWGNTNNTYYNGSLIGDNFYYRYYESSASTSLQSNSTTGTVILDSSLNTYLNNTWYNALNFKNQIVTHSFYVGGLHYKDGYLGGDKGLLKEKKEEYEYIWNGKVALLSITEYAESSINSSCTSVYSNFKYNVNIPTVWPCAIDNYNIRSYVQWSITAVSTTKVLVWTMRSTQEQQFDVNNAFNNFWVRPAFYLNSSIVLTGDGSSENPYRID